MIKFNISAKAMCTIEGSEISNDPVKYDGGSQGARDAFEALANAEYRRLGKGATYIVEATREGADTIRDYCWVVGSTWANESEPDIRADGRALLLVSERIEGLLA